MLGATYTNCPVFTYTSDLGEPEDLDNPIDDSYHIYSRLPIDVTDLDIIAGPSFGRKRHFEAA